MKKLNESTIKLISSTYVVSSIELLVKELVENSIDAGSTRIWINLKKYGLERIEVIDDGCGIEDASVVCQKYCTSKISKFTDIEDIQTLGFRGQVLSSICAVSDLSITSNIGTDSSLGNTWVFDKTGAIFASNTVPCIKGTTIIVSNIFCNLPVRLQVYRSMFMLQKSVKVLSRYLQQLYMCRPAISFRLTNDNNVVFNYPKADNPFDRISAVFGTVRMKQFRLLETIDVDEMSVSGYLPVSADDRSGLTNSDYKDICFLFVNGRPVEILSIFKIVRDVYSEYFEENNNHISKYVMCFLYLQLPGRWIDVNIDPDKRRVRLVNVNIVNEFVERCIRSFYESSTESNIPVVDNNKIQSPVQTMTTTTTTTRHYLKAIRPTPIDDCSQILSTDNKSIEIFDKCNAPIQSVIHNDDLYPLGRLGHIVGEPVSNIGLKRPMTESENTPKRSKPTNQQPQQSNNKATTRIQSESSAAQIAHLSLTALNNVVKPINSMIKSVNKLNVIACWNAFVICANNNSSDVNDDINSMVIFSKKAIITTSIFMDNLNEVQVPGEKLQNEIVIDDRYQNLLSELTKLPVQLIYNNVTERQFHVISSAHLIKNGFRINSYCNDGCDKFNVIFKPVIVEDAAVIDEIEFILSNVATAKSVIRSPKIKDWILKASEEKAREILDGSTRNSELNSTIFWKQHFCNVQKYSSLLDVNECLPELFRCNI